MEHDGFAKEAKNVEKIMAARWQVEVWGRCHAAEALQPQLGYYCNLADFFKIKVALWLGMQIGMVLLGFYLHLHLHRNR